MLGQDIPNLVVEYDVGVDTPDVVEVGVVGQVMVEGGFGI